MYSSRAGEKLDFAIKHFQINVKDKTVADFGSSTGGFVDCLLKYGAKKVFAIDTAYGELDYKLRQDSRVVVMERTNALYVNLPEKVDIVTIDVGWTRQKLIIPKAIELLKKDGVIISLLKPHYEAPRNYLKKGKLEEEYVEVIVDEVIKELKKNGLKVMSIKSPIVGKSGGNVEYLLKIKLG